MTILIPRVWVTLPSGKGLLRSEATMLGRPTRVKGKPAWVEVVTDRGRYTLAPYEAVQAANEAGESLLAYVPPGPGEGPLAA